MALTDKALAVDDFESANRWATLAESAAARGNDRSLLLQSRERSAEVKSVQGDFLRVKGAMARLQSQPDDPNANLAAGKFFCFAKGDWEKGLPMLAKGADAAIKALAAKDLAGASNIDGELAIGDAWRDFAKFQPTTAKRGATGRAEYWYETALSNAKGLSRVAVFSRLRTMPAESSFGRLATDFAGKHGKTEMASGAAPRGEIDEPPAPGFLIGFDSATYAGGGRKFLKFIRAIYLTEKGRVTGQALGSGAKDIIAHHAFESAEAKPGYAVGAIITDHTGYTNGFSIVFMRVHGDVLDPDDRYESPWFGGHEAPHTKTLGGDGRAVIGIQCIHGADINDIGLIQLGEDLVAASGK